MSHLYREFPGNLSSTAESAEAQIAAEVVEDEKVAAAAAHSKRELDEKKKIFEQGPQKNAPPVAAAAAAKRKGSEDDSSGIWDDDVSSLDNTTKAVDLAKEKKIYHGAKDDDESSAWKSETTMEPRYPGAERVRGINATDSDADLYERSSLRVSSSVPMGDIRRDEQPRELVDAVLVDREEEERIIAERLRAQQKQDLPLAEAVKERPWYRRRSFIAVAGLIVVATIATVLAVVLTKDNNDSPVSSITPTVSPAPTALAVITTVLLLDDKPQETGWKLECDGDLLEEAAPGTYALISGAVPYFRIEYVAETFVGAECQLTLTDTGGDGLNPGLFEVYYGDSIAETSNRITGGTIISGELPVAFVAEPKDDTTDTSAPGPTPAPTVVDDQPGCTVCPDGTPVPFPDAKAARWGATTCLELEDIAKNEATDTTECKNIRNAAASCGCPNFCTTICPDGTSEPAPEKDDAVVFVRNLQQVTCGFFQSEIAASNSNSMLQCLSANFLGEDVCGCPPTDDFCHLCLDGKNPPPEALEREIVPGFNCRDIVGIAYTLRPADPSTNFDALCPACLGIGAYCGCDIPSPEEREFCRLCGGNDKLLPEPARLVESTVLGQTTTCYHVEFAANIASPDTLPCAVYQEDSALDCCF